MQFRLLENAELTARRGICVPRYTVTILHDNGAAAVAPSAITLRSALVLRLVVGFWNGSYIRILQRSAAQHAIDGARTISRAVRAAAGPDRSGLDRAHGERQNG